MTDAWLEGRCYDDLTKRELSTATGFSLAAIDSLVRKGMPHRALSSRREGLRFDLPAVCQWLTSDDAKGERRKLAAAQTKLKELEFLQKSKQTILRKDAIAIYSEQVAEFRTRLIEIPHQIDGLTDAQCEALNAAIDGALAEFSGMPEPGQ